MINGDVFSKHYDRWQAIKPSMHTRANAFVFLAELRDIQRMWNILPMKHFSLGDWRTVLQFANAQHLNWNFGVKPFCRDVEAAFSAADTFDRRLSKFVSEQDKLLKRRFADRAQTVTWKETVQGPFFKLVYEGECEIVRASSFHYSYHVPEYSDKELRWRAWADALGANVSLKNLWAIVPWSFVLGYFVNINPLLDAASEGDWLVPEVRLYQACSSLKATGHNKLTLEWTNPYGTKYQWPVAEIGFSYYLRQPGAPNLIVTLDNLDADKIRLSASLLYGLIGYRRSI